MSIEIVKQNISLSVYGKKKLEYIIDHSITRDFPKTQPTLEWAGAVLDLLEDLNLLNINKIKQISIDDLDISIRCYRSLKQQNIKYLNQLCLVKRDMLKVNGFGSKSLKERDIVMQENGLSWLS